MKDFNEGQVNEAVKFLLETETAEFKALLKEIASSKKFLKELFEKESGNILTNEVSVIANAKNSIVNDMAKIKELLGADTLELCKKEQVSMGLTFTKI